MQLQQCQVQVNKAEVLHRRFKILCAGGDGTVAWILGTIHKLALQPAPQVAVMPLGTGNDLSLTFGWGNAFLDAWIKVSWPCPWKDGFVQLDRCPCDCVLNIAAAAAAAAACTPLE